VGIIKLLLDKGIAINFTSTHYFAPLYISDGYGHLDATKVSVEISAAINITNKYALLQVHCTVRDCLSIGVRIAYVSSLLRIITLVLALTQYR
jgi:hypothetical protein